MRLICALVVALLVQINFANAYTGTTGNEVHEICSKSDNTSKLRILHIFLGLEEMRFYYEDMIMKDIKSDLKACISDRVIGQQKLDVYCKFIDENPRMRELPAGLLYAWAMRDAWPCK